MKKTEINYTRHGTRDTLHRVACACYIKITTLILLYSTLLYHSISATSKPSSKSIHISRITSTAPISIVQ